MQLIKASNVTLALSGKTVFNDLSFVVEAGAKIALLGDSGVGKTSLLNLVCGLHQPLKGNLNNRAKRIGYAFQEPRLLPWLTVSKNIEEVMKPYGFSADERQHKIAYLLTVMQLTHCANYYPHQLSGGMAQRVSLARAFAIEPDLLLLDEPFSALDKSLRHQLSEFLAQFLQPQTTLIYVSHSPEDVLHLTDQCLVLDREYQCSWHQLATEQQRRTLLDNLYSHKVD